MKRISFTKCLVSVFLATSVALFIGCGDPCPCGGDDNGNNNNGNNNSNNNNGGGGAGDRKQLFDVNISRGTSDMTYFFEIWVNYIYPFPKFLVNGIELDYDQTIMGFEMEGGGFSAGNHIYSIIWDGDTLTRTLNLPNNIYSLVKDSTETQYRYKITGDNGDEKVLWSARNSDYNYICDTLQANKEFVFPKDYKFSSCYVMHKDFKPLTFGYSATAESKKIAVYENIGLWYFYNND